VLGRTFLQVWRAQPVGQKHLLPACEGTRVNQAFQGNWGLLLTNFMHRPNLGSSAAA